MKELQTFEVIYSYHCDRLKLRRTNVYYFGNKPFIYKAVKWCEWGAFCAIRKELEKTESGRRKLADTVTVESYKKLDDDRYKKIVGPALLPHGFFE